MPMSDNFMDNYRTCCNTSKTRLKVKAVAHDKWLDFNADRLEPEDWHPLLKALRNDRKLHTLVIKSDFLWRASGRQWRYPADCRPRPAVHKPAILDELVEAVCVCMKRSKILSTVHLQSLPLTKTHLDKLAAAIKQCKSLQNLMLTRFDMCDSGFDALYDAVHSHTGLNMIDLSGCSLTSDGARKVARLVRTQRLARYDETWKQSLRYREPDQEIFPGLRRITLNDNPSLGDAGFAAIVHELMDDLWVKAIDVQNCGLTSVSVDHAMELLNVNNVVIVLDLNRNKIPNESRNKIKTLLTQRNQTNAEDGCNNSPQNPVYEWLENTSDRTYTRTQASSRKSYTNPSVTPPVPNTTKNNQSTNNSHLTVELHQTKRVLDDTKRYLVKEREKREELENEKKQQKAKLAEKFIREWNKRKQIEKERDRLRDELHSHLSDGHIPNRSDSIKSSTTTLSNRSKIRRKSKKLIKTVSKFSNNGSAHSIQLENKTKTSKKNPANRANRSNYKMLRTIEKSKRQNGKNEYEINNTEQVQLMQKNLDKLNFNVSKDAIPLTNPNQTQNASQPNDTEPDDSEVPVPTTPNSTVDAANLPNQKNLRDLSPVSRSQWIFNEIMIGKSRRQRKNATKTTSLHNGNNKIDKCFPFQNAPKWGVKV